MHKPYGYNLLSRRRRRHPIKQRRFGMEPGENGEDCAICRCTASVDDQLMPLCSDKRHGKVHASCNREMEKRVRMGVFRTPCPLCNLSAHSRILPLNHPPAAGVRRTLALLAILAIAASRHDWATKQPDQNICPPDIARLSDVNLGAIAAQGIGSTNEVDYGQGHCALQTLRHRRSVKGSMPPDRFLFKKALRLRRKEQVRRELGVKRRHPQTPINRR